MTEGDEQRGQRERRVVIWTGVFLPGFKGGGPVKSLVEMIQRLPPDIVCVVITADRDLGDAAPYPGLSGRALPWGRHTIAYVDWRRPLAALRLLRHVGANRSDLLYLNSFWSPLYSMAPVLALRLRLVKAGGLLVAPRGQLSPGALSLKAQKKRTVMALWAPLLRRAWPLFQVSTALEAAEVTSQLPWARTIVQINSRGPEPREDVVPPTASARFVFLSRISPKKNLALALAAVKGLSSQVTFDIFGPIEDRAYWAECSRLISTMPGHVEVRYLGEIPPERVTATFANYDAFVFPTLGENFGHVIAESLAAGCPVVCSDRTPWNDVFAAGGGVAVSSLEVEAWTGQLERLASLKPEARAARKKSALDAFRVWQRRAVDRPAIEAALARLDRFYRSRG